MMYSNYNLEGQVNFEMTRNDFKTLIDTLGGDAITPVRLGVSFRTDTTNLVAKEGNNLVFETPFLVEHSDNFTGVILSLQKMMYDELGLSPLNYQAMQHSILVPMGAYLDDEGMIIYFHVIFESEWSEAFKVKDSIKFVPIDENTLNNCNKGSIMILPTLKKVSVK